MSIVASDKRRTLLEQLSQLTFREAELFDARTTFLPLRQHREALAPPCVLILGERGAGKSAFFRILIQQREMAPLRQLFENNLLPDVDWLDAFSEAPGHPNVFVVDELALKQGPAAVRAFWLAHLLRRLHGLDATLLPQSEDTKWLLTEVRSGTDSWMGTAAGRVAQLGAMLDGVESALAAQDRRVCAVYDHLDHIGAFHPEVRRNAVGTLLALWHSLSLRFKHLRGKVLLREDLFDDVTASFADASKLRARAVTLRWSEGDLFRVLVRHMSAAGKELAAWLQEIPELSFRDVGEFGLLPGDMPDGAQKALCSRLVGAVVGSGLTQTYTHRWLRASVLDTRHQAVPRTLVSLIGSAAAAALDAPKPQRSHLLTAKDLSAGLMRASLDRMRELREDHPVVRRLENLARREMPMRESVLVKFLAKKVPHEVPGLPEDGDAVLTRLMQLGVVLQRGSDKLYDVPDLYLYGFELSRVVEEGKNDRQEIQVEFGRLLAQGESALSQDFPATADVTRRLADKTQRLAGGAMTLLEALKLRPSDRQALITLAKLTDRRVGLLPAAEGIQIIKEALAVIEPALLQAPASFLLADEVGELFEDLAFREPTRTLKYLCSAELLYKNALQIKPDYFSARLHLARNLVWQAGVLPQDARLKLEEATSHWKRGADLVVETLAGPGAQAWVRRIHGIILEAQALWCNLPERLDAAIAEFKQAIAIAWTSPYGWCQLGLARIHQARSIGPDLRDRLTAAENLLSESQLINDRLAEADDSLREALWIEPGWPQAECGVAYISIRNLVDEGSFEQIGPIGEKLEGIARYSPAAACYPLACFYGVVEKHELCEEQLSLAKSFGQLPPADHLSREPALASVQNRPFLRQIFHPDLVF